MISALEMMAADDSTLAGLSMIGVSDDTFWSTLTEGYINYGNKLRASGRTQDAAGQYEKAAKIDRTGKAQTLLDGMQPYLVDPSLLFIDDFDDNRNNWIINTEDAYFKRSIGDGRLWLSLSRVGWWYWDNCDACGELTNFVIQVDAQMVEGHPRNSFGIIVGDNGRGNYFYFMVSASGEYYLGGGAGGSEFRLPVANTGISNTDPNQVLNLLLAVANGRMTPFVNGNELNSLEIGRPIVGRIGLVVKATEKPIVVGFDNMRIWRTG